MAKCIKKGCEDPVEEGSNYCASHQPGKQNSKKVLKHSPAKDSGTSGGGGSPRGKPGPRPPPK